MQQEGEKGGVGGREGMGLGLGRGWERRLQKAGSHLRISSAATLRDVSNCWHTSFCLRFGTCRSLHALKASCICAISLVNKARSMLSARAETVALPWSFLCTSLSRLAELRHHSPTAALLCCFQSPRHKQHQSCSATFVKHNTDSTKGVVLLLSSTTQSTKHAARHQCMLLVLMCSASTD